ncbi:MAG: hypothetical protein MUC36_07430 [Planctomycetes bacterium]|jgi:hypothetical protein|nr:hypothetical protein [Planctomycetota bacterium]
MKKFLSFVLAAALCAPAFAQKMGGTNSDAPTISQTIEAGAGKMSLNYTAVTWAEGKTMARIMDKEKGAGMRKRISENAASAPLGSMTSSVDVKCGDLHLPAGTYEVFFTIDEDLNWSINFKSGEKVHTHKLALADSGHESKRLMLCLYAAEKGAGVYVAFGNKSGDLQLSPHKAETK